MSHLSCIPQMATTTILSSQTLRLPDIRLRTPYMILPRPNAIDQWLLANHIDTLNNVLDHSRSHMEDVPSDQVSCTLQLTAVLVNYYFEVCSIMRLIFVNRSIDIDTTI